MLSVFTIELVASFVCVCVCVGEGDVAITRFTRGVPSSGCFIRDILFLRELPDSTWWGVEYGRVTDTGKLKEAGGTVGKMSKNVVYYFVVWCIQYKYIYRWTFFMGCFHSTVMRLSILLVILCNQRQKLSIFETFRVGIEWPTLRSLWLKLINYSILNNLCIKCNCQTGPFKYEEMNQPLSS